MKGKKTSAKDKAKVIQAKLNDPDLSLRDIQKKTGVDYSVAGRILNNDLPQVATQSERIASFIDANNRIISIGQKILENYIPATEIESMGDLNQLASILEKAYKQNQLATGGSTENQELKIKIFDD